MNPEKHDKWSNFFKDSDKIFTFECFFSKRGSRLLSGDRSTEDSRDGSELV
jgi:hypothetical protein